MKTVYQQWQSYERQIVPKGADAVQREECRRAFYAGAAAMFGLVMAATEPTNEDECEARLTALDTELGAFTKDMRMT